MHSPPVYLPAHIHLIKDVIICKLLHRSGCPLSSQPSFSERQGLAKPPEIKYRDTFPRALRQPLFDLLRRYTNRSFLWERIEAVLNPYGLVEWPSGPPIAVSRDEDHPDTVAAKRVLMNCEWFQVYDVLEDIYGRLDFHENFLAPHEEAEEGEELRTIALQREVNEYFRYAGIGWQMIKGLIVSRGDDAFEVTVKTAESELADGGRVTAADRIAKAIRNLSARPTPDFSGAISHATGAMECVLNDLTGEKKTLGDYLKRYQNLFPGNMREALKALWGFTSQEGARHGQEGVEPPREDAEFVVAIAAAVSTYLNRKHPRP